MSYLGFWVGFWTFSAVVFVCTLGAHRAKEIVDSLERIARAKKKIAEIQLRRELSDSRVL